MKKHKLLFISLGLISFYASTAFVRCTSSSVNVPEKMKETHDTTAIQEPIGTNTLPIKETTTGEKNDGPAKVLSTKTKDKRAKEPSPKNNDMPSKEPSPKDDQELTGFYLKSAKGTVQGTSTLHNWESEITKIECKGSFQSVNNKFTEIKDVEVKIPVESIQSKEGNKMDNKIYEAFKSDKNPFITYVFSNALVRIDALQNVTIDAYGSLTMAGTNRMVPITATGKVLANGDLALSFSKKLKMTDFKMEPPTAIMGTIRSGDEVTINFDLVLAKSK